MQNPFNVNSLRRNVPNRHNNTQNYGIVPDRTVSLQQNYYGALPYNNANQYDSYSRQFQNELELKHHLNSLLNIFPYGDERKELNTDWSYEGSSVQWCSREDCDRWSTTTQQHNTLPQQQQQLQHINDGSWVTFNNV